MSDRAAIATRLSAILAASLPGVPLAAQELDANLAFVPPVNSPWVRLTFQDGTERVFPGSPTQLARTPVLAFIDAFTQIGIGDGPAVAMCALFRVGFRRWGDTPSGIRQSSYQSGPEGNTDGYYRKQQIIVFQRSERV